MEKKSIFSNPPTKLKSFKNDLAPICFYFDLFTTEIFKIPVMPVPMRIDKLTNGDGTLFIFPDLDQINEICENLGLIYNFESFFLTGIKNLIKYAKIKYKEITYRKLKTDIINNWFKKSKIIQSEILDLKISITFMISEFLKTYSKIIDKYDTIKNQNDYKSDLIQYSVKIINYFKDKIEENIFQIEKDEFIKKEQLYTKKREYYFPNIIPVNIYDLKKKKTRKMSFVPYLIYDDIFDLFIYNKKLLLENKQKPYKLNLWNQNGIIKNGSNIDKYNSKGHIQNINLNKLKVEKLL